MSNQFIYHAEDNTVREKATMEKKGAAHFYESEAADARWDKEAFHSYLNTYKKHLKHLRTYPCSDACKSLWKDKQDVEEGKDFELKGAWTQIPGKFSGGFEKGSDVYWIETATPLPQTEVWEEEMYDEIERIFDKHTAPTGGGYEADCTDRRCFINELIANYKITRKNQHQ